MDASFQWTCRRLDLVKELLGVLLGTIHEWDTFLSSKGDWGYFSDLDQSPSKSIEFQAAGQSLRSIERTFRRLKRNRQKLLLLKETLQSDLSTVKTLLFPQSLIWGRTYWFHIQLKLLLGLEGNAATESSAFMSKFTIWVCIVSHLQHWGAPLIHNRCYALTPCRLACSQCNRLSFLLSSHLDGSLLRCWLWCLQYSRFNGWWEGGLCGKVHRFGKKWRRSLSIIKQDWMWTQRLNMIPRFSQDPFVIGEA